MSNWTPQDWLLFLGGLSGIVVPAIIAIINTWRTGAKVDAVQADLKTNTRLTENVRAKVIEVGAVTNDTHEALMNGGTPSQKVAEKLAAEVAKTAKADLKDAVREIKQAVSNAAPFPPA